MPSTHPPLSTTLVAILQALSSCCLTLWVQEGSRTLIDLKSHFNQAHVASVVMSQYHGPNLLWDRTKFLKLGLSLFIQVFLSGQDKGIGLWCVLCLPVSHSTCLSLNSTPGSLGIMQVFTSFVHGVCSKKEKQMSLSCMVTCLPAGFWITFLSVSQALLFDLLVEVQAGELSHYTLSLNGILCF